MYLRAHALEYARHLGLKVRFYPYFPEYNYRGDGILHLRKEAPFDTITHEIAHWMVATPYQRTLLEFGLGPSIESHYTARAPVHRSLAAARSVEEQASILGIALQYALHDPDWQMTYDQHNWNDVLADVEGVVRTLQRKGCMTQQGTPRGYLRFHRQHTSSLPYPPPFLQEILNDQEPEGD